MKTHIYFNIKFINISTDIIFLHYLENNWYTKIQKLIIYHYFPINKVISSVFSTCEEMFCTCRGINNHGNTTYYVLEKDIHCKNKLINIFLIKHLIYK